MLILEENVLWHLEDLRLNSYIVITITIKLATQDKMNLRGHIMLFFSNIAENICNVQYSIINNLWDIWRWKFRHIVGTPETYITSCKKWYNRVPLNALNGKFIEAPDWESQV